MNQKTFSSYSWILSLFLEVTKSPSSLFLHFISLAIPGEYVGKYFAKVYIFYLNYHLHEKMCVSRTKTPTSNCKSGNHNYLTSLHYDLT